MTKFFILATTRALIFVGLGNHLTSSIIQDRARRLGCIGVSALLLAAFLDGKTPDGWDFEYQFGHPFWFYLFVNAPVVFGVVTVFLIWPRRNPD